MQQSSGTLKELSLELGGNAPFIVFDHADLEVAVASALGSKFKVTGQACLCANRMYVQEGIYGLFRQRLVEEVKKVRVGNGLQLQDDSVTHGPMTIGVSKMEKHIKDAVNRNVKVLLGGNRRIHHRRPGYSKMYKKRVYIL